MCSSIALELARGGRSVVALDAARTPGDGSTSASSAIVRFNYSTYDGVAAAWESKFCWGDWPEHLGDTDPAALAGVCRTGAVHLGVPIVSRADVVGLLDRADVGDEELSPDDRVRRLSRWGNATS